MTKILVYIVESRGETYPKNNHGFKTDYNDHDPKDYEKIAEDAAWQEYQRNWAMFAVHPLVLEIFNSLGNSIGRFVVDFEKQPIFLVKKL